MTPRSLKFLGGGLVPDREWLTMAELAEHGKFPTAEAARKFVTRHPDLPRGRKGRQLVVDRATFDRYLQAAGHARKVS